MPVNDSLFSFGEGVTKIGMKLQGLKCEEFRTDGTFNYVANLNYQGQTWAAALRLPAKGARLEEFLIEKYRALHVVEYLMSVLKDGIGIGFDSSLKFEGVSCLVEGSSAHKYLRSQGSEKPLELIDLINNRKKIIEGIDYPSALADDAKQYVPNYAGPFYLSRGAPARETLEDYPELEEPVAYSLAALHLITGQGTPVPFETARQILDEVAPVVHEGALRYIPIEGSKEERALKKSMNNWKADDPERIALVRQERFMRTSTGQELFRSTLHHSLQRHALPDQPLKSFSHGDCHGGNFIIVRYQYILNQGGVLLDREFLNKIFESDQTLSEVAVTIDRQGSYITHARCSSANPSALIARRKFRHDIHLIDLDSGRGTTDDTKVLHLYDTLFYALSLANLTQLFASPVNSREILRHYYDGLRAKV
jgi:hypothetical protein